MNGILTATECASKERNGTKLTRLSVCVSVRCNHLIEDGCKCHTQANIDTMDKEQDPVVTIFGKHFESLEEWRPISGLSICRWRFRLGWHEDQWDKSSSCNSCNDNQLIWYELDYFGICNHTSVEFL
jgi:hypothetical protein